MKGKEYLIGAVMLVLIVSVMMTTCNNQSLDEKLKQSRQEIDKIMKEQKTLEAISQRYEKQAAEAIQKATKAQEDANTANQAKVHAIQAYDDLKKKLGTLSADEQDKVLKDKLKSHSVLVEIKPTFMNIDQPNRFNLLSLVVDYEKQGEVIGNTEKEISGLRTSLTEYQSAVSLKDADIQVLKEKNTNYESIMTNMNQQVKLLEKKFKKERIKKWMMLVVPIAAFVGVQVLKK